MTHYIGMAGIHGCLPQTCDVYNSQKEAAEGLAQIHDLGRNRRRKLARDGYLELNLHRDGNEYAEITACDCDTPAVHSDSEIEHDPFISSCRKRPAPKPPAFECWTCAPTVRTQRSASGHPVSVSYTPDYCRSLGHDVREVGKPRTISLVPCGFCYEGRETEPVTLYDGKVKWLCPKCRQDLAENPILCPMCKKAPRWVEGQGTTCGCGGVQAYERRR